MRILGRIGLTGGARVKPALGVQTVLKWTLRMEKAQLELPKQRDMRKKASGSRQQAYRG